MKLQHVTDCKWSNSWTGLCSLHRNRRYCRRCRRYDQTVIPTHLPARCRTLPSRLQIWHTCRQAATTVKTTLSPQWRYFSAVLTGLYLLFLNHIFVGFGRFLLSSDFKPLSRHSHRNKTDTFQCLNKQLCRLYLQYFIWVYILYHVYMSKWENVTDACNFRLVSYCIHKTLFL